MWTDIWETGCNVQFGNPSGHSIEAFLFSSVFLLDIFAPSDYSREVYPHLNMRTVSNSKCLFCVAILFALTFCPLIMVDRLILGKHMIDQVILGACIGVWGAFLLHYCLRDTIFTHFTEVSSGSLIELEANMAKHVVKSLTLSVVFFLITVVTAYSMSLTATIEQT